MSSVLSKILAAVLPHVVDLASAAAVALFAWLTSRVSTWLKAHTKHQEIASVLLRMNDAAATAVKFVEQGMRPLVEAAAADGVVTDDEKRAMKAAAMASMRKYLGEKGTAEAVKVLGLDHPASLEHLIESKVEAAVLDMKNAGPGLTVVNTVPALDPDDLNPDIRRAMGLRGGKA